MESIVCDPNDNILWLNDSTGNRTAICGPTGIYGNQLQPLMGIITSTRRLIFHIKLSSSLKWKPITMTTPKSRHK